jgi:hypothetical protein
MKEPPSHPYGRASYNDVTVCGVTPSYKERGREEAVVGGITELGGYERR